MSLNYTVSLLTIRRILMAGIVLCIVGGATTQALAESRQQLLANVWKQYDAGDDKAVIKNATACLFEAGDQARLVQSRLAATHTPQPLTGASDRNSKEARAIFDRGLLNDVGACQVMLAKSYARLHQCADAAQAYRAASALTYARVWDESQSIFWSPAEAAEAWIVGHPGGKC